jgi:signal transduction histidine kinase
MRERIEHLGGSLSIDSSPGQGTRLRASVPG